MHFITGFLGKYKLYLILGAILIALVGGNILYIRHLQSSNQRLNDQNIQLSETLRAEQAARQEQERRHEINNQVTNQFDEIRDQNRVRFQGQRQRVEQSVREGQDRPVGPLLERFFNSENR